jgi:soluble lytic murein transglycosylase-like protein
MMQIEAMQEIQTRIQQIQQRFGMPMQGGVPGFQQVLANQMKDDASAASSGAVKKAAAPVSASSDAKKAFSAAGGSGGASAAAPGSVDAMIQTAAKKYGVDPKLVTAVAETESGENQSAVSSAGAVGVMQLMPDTAAGLGVNPYDEEQNIEGGAHYLHDMLETFGGDVKKAVAAYNAGSQAVKDYNGVPPYRETQDYVNKVLDLYQ